VKDILERLFPDVPTEDRLKALESYCVANKKGRELLAESVKGISHKDFEEAHKMVTKLYEPEFLKLKEATDGVQLGMGEFHTELNRLKLFNGMPLMTVGMNEMFALYNFFLYGSKIYSISHNLSMRFKATNIKSVPIELLKLPFKSFQLNIPEGVLKYQTYEGKDIFIKEIIVTDFYEKENQKRYLHINHRTYDDIGYFKITIGEDEVHKCVDESIKSMAEFAEKEREATGQEPEFNELHKQEIKDIFEFTVKSILYITGADADVRWVDESLGLTSQLARAKARGKRKKLERRLANAKKMYLVGHTIILSREEKVMYRGLEQGLWKLSYRFIVQGHWRQQAYGEKNSLRKLIFIEPFWKGPKFSDVVNNPHLIK